MASKGYAKRLLYFTWSVIFCDKYSCYFLHTSLQVWYALRIFTILLILICRRLSRCMQLGGLALVIWLGVTPRYKASKLCNPLQKLKTRALKSPSQKTLDQGSPQQSCGKIPRIRPTPPPYPSPNLGALVKGHFGTLVSASWTSSVGLNQFQKDNLLLPKNETKILI